MLILCIVYINCNWYISVNDGLLQEIAEANKDVTDGESSKNDIGGDDDDVGGEGGGGGRNNDAVLDEDSNEAS